MILHHTDKHGRYNGKKSEARLNPNYRKETHDIIDKYIYNPRTESLLEPLDAGENEACQLVDKKWFVVTDRIGQHYYQPDGTRIDIEEIGVDVPPGMLQEDPPTEYHDKHNGVSWIEDTDRRDIKEWEIEIARTDRDMPRYMEDHIKDAHSGVVGNSYGQAKYDNKQDIRARKPNK